jgi:hypothetical protein
MLLIIKDRPSEPTIFVKTTEISKLSYNYLKPLRLPQMTDLGTSKTNLAIRDITARTCAAARQSQILTNKPVILLTTKIRVFANASCC